MEKSHTEPTDTIEAMQALDTYVREQVNAGHELPIGYLFKGLTLFFHRSSPEEADSSENDATEMERQFRLRMAMNTASFAGANVVSSSDDSAITHVIVDPACSADEISSFRESWATGRKKLPHLVTVEWIEECWDQRTVLDEERMFPLLPLFSLNLV